MKLHELLEDTTTYDSVMSRVKATPRRAPLGQGRENAAYFKPSQADTAYRVSQHDQATTVLMRTLAGMRHSNPFLPSVRATRGIGGGVQITVTDRLLPLSTLHTTEELLQVISQVVGPDIDKVVFNDKVPTALAIKDKGEWLATLVFWYLEHGESPFTSFTYVNPYIAEVRDLLQRVIADATQHGIKAQVDHANVDNIMLRRTGSGYQLVINDPLTSQR